MESELAMRAAQLASFVEQVPAAIALFDIESRYVAVSRSFILSILDVSVSPSEVIGRSHYETFPDTPACWRKFHARVLAGEEITRAEYPLARQDGRIDWVRWSMKPWYTTNGTIGGALMAAELTTDLVEAKRSAAEKETRFQATFDNAAVGIAHVAPNGRFLRVNEALCRILGYPVGELLTKSIQDVTFADDFVDDLAQVELVRQGKVNSYDIEARYVRKDGVIIWGKKTVGCVRRDEASIDYFIIVIEDLSAHKNVEKELRENEERFRSSLLHSPSPIMLFDDREHILAISQSWLKQSGYSREDLRRIEDWTSRAHGKRSAVALEQIRQVLIASTEVRLAGMVIRTKDGRERMWNFLTTAVPPHRIVGRRLFVCVAQDVTDQKAHEEQIHLLMREIDHRARNMLSLVQTIARQTQALEPEDFIERFTARIQALAVNQELLAQNEWQGVDVEDQVRAQLAHFADLAESRITMHGPPVRLNPAAAQTIGLAVHELAANACKYGALSVTAGRVDVCWQSENGVFTMKWAERNGPRVRPPELKGFGTTVIDSMIGQALGAEVQLDYAPLGLVWRLTCPAQNALSAVGIRDSH